MERKNENKELDDLIEKIHSGEVTQLPDGAGELIDDAGVEQDIDDSILMFVWVEYPDDEDFEPESLEGKVSDERYADLMDGACPTP